MKTRSKIFFSVGFVLTLYCILVLIQGFYTSHLLNICEKPIWVQKLNGREFDFIVCGSSRAENHVDVNTIEDLTDYNGINIAYEGSAFSENYLALYVFLKNGNKARYILLNADEWGVIDQKKAYNYPFHGYYYFNSMGNDTIDELIKENYGSLKYFLWKYIPFIKYAEYNNIYNPCRMYCEKPVNFEMHKGSDLLSVKTAKDWDLGTNMLVPDAYSIKNLSRIIDLCRTYRTKLIFFSPPNYHEVISLKKIGNRDTCIGIVKDLALKNDIEYWDFSVMKDISWNKDLFYNANHLNSEGAKLFSGVIARKILEINGNNIKE